MILGERRGASIQEQLQNGGLGSPLHRPVQRRSAPGIGHVCFRPVLKENFYRSQLASTNHAMQRRCSRNRRFHVWIFPGQHFTNNQQIILVRRCLIEGRIKQMTVVEYRTNHRNNEERQWQNCSGRQERCRNSRDWRAFTRRTKWSANNPREYQSQTQVDEAEKPDRQIDHSVTYFPVSPNVVPTHGFI